MTCGGGGGGCLEIVLRVSKARGDGLIADVHRTCRVCGEGTLYLLEACSSYSNLDTEPKPSLKPFTARAALIQPSIQNSKKLDLNPKP